MRGERNGRVLFTGGSIFKTRLNIFFGEVRKIFDDLFTTHPGRDPPQYVTDSDPDAADARLAPSFARFNRDDLAVIHTARILCQRS